MLQGLCGPPLNTRCRFTRHFVVCPAVWSVGYFVQGLTITSAQMVISSFHLYSYRLKTATHLLSHKSAVPIHRANWRSLVTSPSLSLFQSSVIGSSHLSCSQFESSVWSNGSVILDWIYWCFLLWLISDVWLETFDRFNPHWAFCTRLSIGFEFFLSMSSLLHSTWAQPFAWEGRFRGLLLRAASKWNATCEDSQSANCPRCSQVAVWSAELARDSGG